MIRSIAPGTNVADLSHLVRAFAVREGAMVLAECVPWFPQSVHLAVIDPGVGSARRALILSVAEGSLFVGPDNGLLMPSAARLGGVEGAWEITNPQLGLPSRSSTFHGRDVFAPAAAHLFAGVPPDQFGPEVPVDSLTVLPVPQVKAIDGRLFGEVVQVDRFGNCQTSFGREHLAALRAKAGDRLELRVGERVLEATVRQSYSYGEAGEVQLVVDSHGSVALCVNRGSAADLLAGVAPGTTLLLGTPGIKDG